MTSQRRGDFTMQDRDLAGVASASVSSTPRNARQPFRARREAGVWVRFLPIYRSLAAAAG
jgi:hypothetical protein